MGVGFTIGPSSWELEQLDAISAFDVSVVRFPFAKEDIKIHARNVKRVKQVFRKSQTRPTMFADLPGGKPRLNNTKPVMVRSGNIYQIKRGDREGDSVFGVTEHLNFERLNVGQKLIVGDGENIFVVQSVASDKVTGCFACDGIVERNRAIVPRGHDMRIECLTERDIELGKAALEMGIDALALSFVSSRKDVESAREAFDLSQNDSPFLIAKIETGEGLENCLEITESADAVMLGRGDAGLSLGFSKLRAAQRDVANACRINRKRAICATGFLDSLAARAEPSRAEVVDFMSAFEDGFKDIILCEPTTIGWSAYNAISWASEFEREVLMSNR